MARIRSDYVFGTISTESGISDTATAFDSAELARLPAVTAPDVAAVTLHDSSAGVYEIVHVTAHIAGATTATILRAQEGSTAQAWGQGTTWLHGPTAEDFADSGGGGGVSVKDRRWSIPSGWASIDEFNDDTLAADWVRVDNATGGLARATWTEGGDSLSVIGTGADGSQELHGMVRPLTTAGGSMVAGDAFVTCLTLYAERTPDAELGCGLVIAAGTTYGSSQETVVAWFAGDQDAGQVQDIRWWRGYDNMRSASGSARGHSGVPVFVRLVMVSSGTWRADLSPDGVSWVLGPSTMSVSMTPTHVGLVYQSTDVTALGVGSFEFLRRVSGVT